MFQAPKLTNAGKDLYYRNMGSEPIKFTTIQMGSGNLSGPIATMTALVNPLVSINASVKKNADYIEVSGKFSNASIPAGFYWREIGIFAENPADPNNRAADILYCYQNAYDTADYIPVASVETVEKNITVPVIVGDASNVSCTLSGSLVMVSMKELDDHSNDTTKHVGATAKATPVDADSMVLVDSADGNKQKRLSWAAIKSALSSVFAAASHNHNGTYEPAITKKTAFNVDFETTATNIKKDGTASVGSLGTAARADHIHPSDTSKVDITLLANILQATRNLNLVGGGEMKWGVASNTFSWSKTFNIYPIGGIMTPSGVAIRTITIAAGSATLANAGDCLYITLPTADNQTVTPAISTVSALSGNDKLVLAIRDVDNCLEILGGGWLVYGTTVEAGGKRDNYIPKTQKGVAGGVAELGSDGKVPAVQLPSYVDDVLEYTTQSEFPATGEAGKIYVAQDSNKTYRWSGSAYVEISASLALGETPSTAYPGDKGKIAYDHSQGTGNPHGTTAAQVGAYTKDEVDVMVKKGLLRDLTTMLNSSLSTSNIDAWGDPLLDTSFIKTATSTNFILNEGKLSRNQDANNFGNLTGESWCSWGNSYKKAGFTFYATSKKLQGIKVKLKKQNNPTDSVVAYLYKGIFDILIATSSTSVASSNLSTTAETEVQFNFNNLQLTEGAQYSLMLERTGSGGDDYQFHYTVNQKPAETATYLRNSANTAWGTFGGRFYYFIVCEPPAYAEVFWLARSTTTILTQIGVAAIQTLGAGSITYHLSEDGVTWLDFDGVNSIKKVAFQTKALHFKVRIYGDATIDALAYGGF